MPPSLIPVHPPLTITTLLEEGTARELVDALEAVAKELELLHAVVDAALVLVDVGPSVPGRAHRGHVARGGRGDPARSSIKTHEHPARIADD